jgi:hypothetical protein
VSRRHWRPPRQFTEAELIAICALAFDAGVKAVQP